MTFRFLSASCALAAASGLLPALAQTCLPAENGAAYLRLDEAIQRALASDLRPAAARAGVAAAQSDRAVAALKPADTLSLEYENFPGLGLGSEISNLEITASFSRVWERGGKRAARIGLAESGVEIAETEITATHVEIAHEVQALYIELAVTLERQALAAQRLDAAIKAEAVIERRVAAARDPLLAGARARADALRAEGDVARLSAEAGALRAALSDYWAGEPDFGVDLCDLSAKDGHPAHDLDISAAPELARLNAERRRAEAAVRLAQSDRAADITWSAGVRKFGTGDDLAVLGGVSIPLGAKARAAPYEQQATSAIRLNDAKAEALHQSLLRESARLERTALAAINAATALETGPLPEAERSVSLAEDGYARGAFSYLDVLDAQRLLFDLMEQRLDLLRTYHLSEAAIARLKAANLPASIQESSR